MLLMFLLLSSCNQTPPQSVPFKIGTYRFDKGPCREKVVIGVESYENGELLTRVEAPFHAFEDCSGSATTRITVDVNKAFEVFIEDPVTGERRHCGGFEMVVHGVDTSVECSAIY